MHQMEAAASSAGPCLSILCKEALPFLLSCRQNIFIKPSSWASSMSASAPLRHPMKFLSSPMLAKRYALLKVEHSEGKHCRRKLCMKRWHC